MWLIYSVSGRSNVSLRSFFFRRKEEAIIDYHPMGRVQVDALSLRLTDALPHTLAFSIEMVKEIRTVEYENVKQTVIF